jgi:tetratricopeptide (TPR) repeat protein
MEPDLLQLAKAAHPPTPVTGIPQLKSIALVVRAEDAIKADNFAEGISDAKQALALDPKSIRGLHDIGIASAYSGDWAEALSNLETAHSLDKNLAQTNDDIKWVKAIQKQAAADPNAMQAWVLVHDADVAQSDESFERAIGAATQVIALEPSWPEGYDRLGLALGGVNQWQDAITALSKAVSLDTHHETNAKQDLKSAKQMQKDQKVR